MKQSVRASSRKSNTSAGHYKQVEMEDLEKLMKSIKNIQSRVQQMPIYLQLNKSSRLSTPKPKNCSKSSRKRQQPFSSKRQKVIQPSQKTLRKSGSSEPCSKTVLTNHSKTFELGLGKHSSVGPGRERSPLVGGRNQQFGGIKGPQLIGHYVSLQLQNLKLQRHNLQLQKKLVEKSLMMERREKQLLKSKLKRMRTQQSYENSQPPKVDSNCKQTLPIISPFDLTPFSLHLPSTKQEPQLPLNKQEHSRKTEQKKRQDPTELHKVQANRNCFEDEVEVDSLLLSEQNENDGRSRVEKREETTLQREFWQLMGDWQGRQKKEVRSALGDIANHLKLVRNK